jgi:hypothetical protein
VSQDEQPVAQALFTLVGDEFRERGRSADFEADWLANAERLCRGIGSRPPGVACPLAIFAQPFGPRHVAVVQASDVANGLSFRFLVLSRRHYANCIADPFRVSDQFPPVWDAAGELAPLTWPNNTPPRRTVGELQHVLQTGGSTTLLGAVQGLIDGGRLVFERAAPATQLVRDLWQLLPYSAQAELWPTTFAFGNDLLFDVLVVPKADGLSLDRYFTEEQALDYPEGRYEFGLQYAIEHGDQRELDRLLGWRSSKQMLRLALYILFGGIVAYVGINALMRLL